MADGPFYEVQCGGNECIICCPVYKECDCNILQCVMDYVEFVKNLSHENHLGFMSSEVSKASIMLVGFVAMGTYWRPVIDGTQTNTFGRTLVYADVEKWKTPGSEWRKWFSFILRVLSYRNFESNPLPQLKEKWCLEGRCNCDEAQLWCDELECIFDTMRTYLEIGNTNNPPYTLEEWERKLCDVCYTDPCTGVHSVRPSTTV